VYRANVSSQVHGYLRPQESGNKVGVRWLSLSEDQPATEPSSGRRARAAAAPLHSGSRAGSRAGLLVVAPLGGPLLSASASHFEPADLDLSSGDAELVSTHHLTRRREVQKHAAELVERNLVSLNIDTFQMGLGGINSWGALPLKMYMLDPTIKHEFAFVLVPYESRSDDIDNRLADRLSQAAAVEATLPAVKRCTLPAA